MAADAAEEKSSAMRGAAVCEVAYSVKKFRLPSRLHTIAAVHALEMAIAMQLNQSGNRRPPRWVPVR
jgi:hypothetical protein